MLRKRFLFKKIFLRSQLLLWDSQNIEPGKLFKGKSLIPLTLLNVIYHQPESLRAAMTYYQKNIMPLDL